MKIWFPKRIDSDEDINKYIATCSLSMGSFIMILNSNLNIPKFKLIETKLIEGKLLDFINVDKFSIMSAIRMYQSYLRCEYDGSEKRCYFDISKMIKCPNTNNSLDYVIRLIEFGNDKIPPSNWIRHSYTKFCEIYGVDEE